MIGVTSLALALLLCLAFASAFKKTVADCYVDKKYVYTHPENVHKESALAHKLLDGLCGIEIGAASYAPFGLKTVNVGLTEKMDPVDHNKYKKHQIRVTGDYARIDIPGNAEDLSNIPTSSVDFVLHSHVWEHLANPLKSLNEWARVVKHRGLLFIMVPHRNALPEDRGRNVTSIKHLTALLDGKQVDPKDVPITGHHTVFSSQLIVQIMHVFNVRHAIDNTRLELVSFLEVDDKIELGHQVCWRVLKGA
jgi:predicted SAM-dependent methyltransferase